MSKTPLTDHYTKRLRNLCDDEFVPIEFARKLERELTAVTEQRDRLDRKLDEALQETARVRQYMDYGFKVAAEEATELREQRDLWKAEAERWREQAGENFQVTAWKQLIEQEKNRMRGL
jgi:hypothetical protein